MPLFEYKGVNSSGKNVSGTIDADHLRTARQKLKKDGLFITEIRDKKKEQSQKKSGTRARRGSITVRDLSLMTRQLATLVKANIPLVDSLGAVSEQVESPVLAEALAEARNVVNEGGSLQKALSRHPHLFSNIYITMCEAGEASGSLDTILVRLADFTESQAELRSKVSGALVYPILMLVVTLGMLGFIFTFLIPKMMVVFENNPDLVLPWYTVLLFDASTVFVNYWYLLLGAVGLVIFLFLSWKGSPTGKKQWDALSLKLPVVGEIVRMMAVSRFTRTLETLLSGGVPMLSALDIVRNVVDNDVIANAVDDARSNISEGESISGPLKRSGQFPPIVIHMVNIGEKTGELENMLQQVANAYDFQVRTKIDAFTGLLGPLVVILMGIAIGGIVISIMMPMFDLMDAMG